MPRHSCIKAEVARTNAYKEWVRTMKLADKAVSKAYDKLDTANQRVIDAIRVCLECNKKVNKK